MWYASSAKVCGGGRMIAIFVLIAFVVVVAGAAALVMLYKGDKLENIRAAATVVSAGAAVAIPVVLYDAAGSARANESKLARNAATLQVMNDVDLRIDAVLTRKRELDIFYGVAEEKRFSPEYVKKHPEVQDQVRRLLNVYEFVCVGVNKVLLSEEIVLAIRRDAFLKTWDDYRDYMVESRGLSPANKESWTDCDRFAEKAKNQAQSPQSTVKKQSASK